jgi:hypothetical protein
MATNVPHTQETSRSMEVLFSTFVFSRSFFSGSSSITIADTSLRSSAGRYVCEFISTLQISLSGRLQLLGQRSAMRQALHYIILRTRTMLTLLSKHRPALKIPKRVSMLMKMCIARRFESTTVRTSCAYATLAKLTVTTLLLIELPSVCREVKFSRCSVPTVQVSLPVVNDYKEMLKQEQANQQPYLRSEANAGLILEMSSSKASLS